MLVDSVLVPLEQSINGVQNMRYMVSSATSAGEATITIYFEPGTDPNINVVNVQNRVNIMLSRLPPLVVREGILVSQVVPSMLMYVNIYSTDPNADQKDLYNSRQPVDDVGNYLDPWSQLLVSGGYSPDEARAAVMRVLPDLLRYDRTKPATYPNGRKLTDDVYSYRFGWLSHGKVGPTGLGPHEDLTESFPYLGPPNP